MKQIFKGDRRPDQNDIILAYFQGGASPQVGKYQSGRIVLSDGRSSVDWGKVIQWRRSVVPNPSALIVENKPAM